MITLSLTYIATGCTLWALGYQTGIVPGDAATFVKVIAGWPWFVAEWLVGAWRMRG